MLKEELQAEEEEYKERASGSAKSDPEEENPAQIKFLIQKIMLNRQRKKQNHMKKQEFTSETQPVSRCRKRATYEEPVQEEVGTC